MMKSVDHFQFHDGLSNQKISDHLRVGLAVFDLRNGSLGHYLYLAWNVEYF